MSDKYQPKLSDALKDQPKADGGSAPPEQSQEKINPADLRQHNREVNAGIQSNKDRLVDIGRGEETAGRQQGRS